jgi:hypothetical protein
MSVANEGPRAWKDCPECGGEGGLEVSDQNWDNPDPPQYKPCPVCAAHFAEVDAARAAGREESREAVAKLVDENERLKLSLMPTQYNDDYWWSECLDCGEKGKSIAEIVHSVECGMNRPVEKRSPEDGEALATPPSTPPQATAPLGVNGETPRMGVNGK